MRTSRMKWLAILGLVVLGGLLLMKARPSQAPATPLRLSVNTWVGFGPFWLAQEKGIYAKHGLAVEIVVMEDTASRTAALTKGEIDAYGDTVDLLVATRDKSVPAVAVMQLDTSLGADGILASADIDQVADLKGKTVAVQQNFVSDAFLDYVLVEHGLTPADLRKIDTEAGAAGAAFVAGQVDAAVTFEPWLSKAQERSGGHVLLTSREIPGVLVDILSVNETYLRDHREAVKDLMRAWLEAVAYWQSHPDEANGMMASHYGVSPAEFAELISGVAWPDLVANRAYFSLTGDAATIQAVATTFSNLFLDLGKIKQPFDGARAIDRTLLEEL